MKILTTLLLGAVLAFSATEGAQARSARHHHHATWHVAHHIVHRSRHASGRTVAHRPARGRFAIVGAHRHRGYLALADTGEPLPIAGGAVGVAMRYLHSKNPTGTRGPWCGDFMNLLERKMGRKGIASRMAPDWRHYGHASAPVYDAIAVFRTHVGRVIRRVGYRLDVISGNYRHRVEIGHYDVRSAIAFRMP